MYGPKTYYVVTKGFGREVCDYYTAETDDEAHQKAMDRCGISIEIKSVKPIAQNEPPYIERNVPDPDTSLRPRPGETPEQTVERVTKAVRKQGGNR